MTKLEKNAAFFHALGDKTRLKILEYLIKNTCKCICHIAEYAGKDQSTVFRHIEILKDAGILETKKQDRYLMCKIINGKKIKKLLED